MSKDSSQSHNLSRPPKADESPPLRQHHRLATGERVTGQSNPYGAEKGNTTDKIANGKPGNY